jgi:uncharacterized glyoxalase superfamily protein PhnB
MTQTRTGDALMPADEYGRALPKFSVNLLVRNVANSLSFYRDVLGASIRYADNDFAALQLQGIDFMLHADHTYDHHYARLTGVKQRGTGAELRVLGIDPDELEQRAKQNGTEILHTSKDFPHGWREVALVDPDGYVWVIGVPTLVPTK